MFVVVGILLFLFALLEITNKIYYKSKVFYIFAVILLLMLCFRYGQGTDYHPYEVQYTNLNSRLSLFINQLEHGELGWYVLLMIFKRLGCSFSMFLGILSSVMMSSTYRAINKYSPYRVLSLFLLYPTFFLTYYYSAIRQGVVLSVFIGFGIQWLVEKKYIKYYFMVIILSLLHSSAIVLLILPVAFMLKDKKPTKYIIAALVFVAIAGYSGILNLVAARMGLHLNYFVVSISIPAIVLRAILFYIIYTMYRVTRNESDKESRIEDVLYIVYVVGFILFIMLSFSGTLSQRITVPMKGVEIILIPILTFKMYRCRNNGTIDITKPFYYLKIGTTSLPLILMIVVLVFGVEMIKNINSYLVQGNYYEWVNVFNYPYISIFNKKDIFSYISHFD